MWQSSCVMKQQGKACMRVVPRDMLELSRMKSESSKTWFTTNILANWWVTLTWTKPTMNSDYQWATVGYREGHRKIYAGHHGTWRLFKLGVPSGCIPDFLLNYESQSSSSSNERNCGCSFGTSLWRKHQSNSEVHPNDKSMVWHDEREESERSCSEKEPWCCPICQCWRPSSELVEHRFSAISEWLEDGRGCQLSSSPKKWASSQTAQSSTKSIVECTRFLLNHRADFVLSISIRTHWNDTLVTIGRKGVPTKIPQCMKFAIWSIKSEWSAPRL